MNTDEMLKLDRQHLWHPYSNLNPDNPLYAVAKAEGVELELSDGRRLVDGMSSWWAAIHGYNHPSLNTAVQTQLGNMAHVMFGGLTHEPAARLAARLASLAPLGLDRVFLVDSGSVSVEVAIKLAVQYWQALGQPQKHKLLSLRGAYHGDTLGAMSLCDPITGMHQLFASLLPQQLFAPRPTAGFNQPCNAADIAPLARLLEQHHSELAALILEPIVQGAGGMHFYSADYLRQARQLCNRYKVLLIADEIATGFGRTGKLFACEHADISPDILCLGKALTGGYLTLAATLCSTALADVVCSGAAGVFMHGPTFMGNPLACAVANASLDVLLSSPWQTRIAAIEQQLRRELAPCAALPNVAQVRCLGAIGVVEMAEPLSLAQVQPWLVESGVWLRPFGKLLYCMPPFIITPTELSRVTAAMVMVAQRLA